MITGIYKINDKENANKIIQAIKDNDGYCPCKIEKIPQTKCMCEEFRLAPAGTICHCGLYYKERRLDNDRN